MNRVKKKVEELKQVLKEETGFDVEPNIDIGFHMNGRYQRKEISLTKANQKMKKLLGMNDKFNLYVHKEHFNPDEKYINLDFTSYGNNFGISFYFPFPELKTQNEEENNEPKQETGSVKEESQDSKKVLK